MGRLLCVAVHQEAGREVVFKVCFVGPQGFRLAKALGATAVRRAHKCVIHHSSLSEEKKKSAAENHRKLLSSQWSADPSAPILGEGLLPRRLCAGMNGGALLAARAPVMPSPEIICARWPARLRTEDKTRLGPCVPRNPSRP